MASPYVSTVLDVEGRILAINARGETTLCKGMTRTEPLIGSRFSALTSYENTEFVMALKRSVASGKIDILPRHPNEFNAGRMMSFRIILLRSGSPGQYHYLLTHDQLHTTAKILSQLNKQRLRAQETIERLEAAHLELYQSLLSMETFAHAASHDLKTPLNTLSGLLELFASKFGADLPEAGGIYVTQMQRAVGQMTDLTGDLLDYAKSTNHDLRAVPLNLATVVREVLTDFETEISGADAQFDLYTNDLSLMAEPMLLHILLSNLVANALKYRSPERPLTVKITIDPEQGRAGAIMIADNGIGFDQGDASKIFRQFYRLNSETEGSGIGLSTCTEICRRHGWKINAEAKPGLGAQFTITF